jgi:hypothetical protein
VTTSPANLIVLANPRTVSATNAPGDIGGAVFVPLLFNATGDEHALRFTLLADPAVLTGAQITAGPDAAGGAIVLDRSAEAAGKVGVTLTLPGSNVFSPGLKSILTARYDVAPGAADNSTAGLGFSNAPVPMHALSAAGGTLPVVFDPGVITLHAVQATISSAPAAGGGAALTVRGLRGRTYQLFESLDLGAWNVVQTQTVGESGVVVFTLPAGGARAFYKAAPAP